MAGLRAAELEVLFTADTAAVSKAEKDVKAAGERVERQKTTKKIGADESEAIKGMEHVETEAKRLVSRATLVKIDADISKAESETEKLREQIDYLKAIAPEVEVTADIARAEAKLSTIDRSLTRLQSARAEMTVDADTSPAEDAFAEAEDSAAESGDGAGKNFGVSIVAALATIPIVGAVVGIGKAAADALVDAFQDGLQVEVGNDRLQALTGISEADALRLGRVSASAYANGFGESLEANMDTTRLALQFDLIDEKSSKQSSQKVIEGLAGIADVLGEDVAPVAQAVTAMLRSGVVKSADEAFDVIATGAREGANRSEDLLDTFIEYPALFNRLGLSGDEALGLINQGLKGGARNSDLAADALKEFQIRATDGSKTSAAGFEAIGLSAEEMTAKIAAGGAGAKEGLDQVLDGLRAIEDPVARNAAAVALFGTQAEDLGDALFNMDLSTAVDQLDGVTGAAQRMFDTLASNDASKLEAAQRNIEVAMQGIQGALASAFADPLADAAQFIAENRGPMIEFFQGLVNGAFDFGETLIDAAADGAEAFGEFISGPGAEMVKMLGQIIYFMGGDTSDIEQLVLDMQGFDEKTSDAADSIRGLKDGLNDTRDTANGFLDGAKNIGYLDDASRRLVESLDAVGLAADGSGNALANAYTVNADGAVTASSKLEGQIRASITAMSEEVAAAGTAGESQEQLAGRYDTATAALVGQLVQMGLTEEQARNLIGTINETPGQKSTEFSSNADAQTEKVKYLGNTIVTLPDGSVIVTADTETASSKIAQFVRDLNNIPGRRDVVINQVVQTTGAPQGQVGAAYNGATGGLLEFMALGGIRNLTPMSSAAQMVSPNSWRVVGDRGDVPELFAPLDGSARSWALILEALARMPGSPSGQAQPVAAASVQAAAGPSGPVTMVGQLEIIDTGNGLRAIIRGEIQDDNKRQKQTRAGDW